MRGGVLGRRIRRTCRRMWFGALRTRYSCRALACLAALKALLTAGASAQMYFVAVYLQLTMLTPLLYRLLARCLWLVYAITR